MGLVKLKPEELRDSIGKLTKVANKDIIETFQNVARVVHNTGDDNELNTQVLAACVKTQEASNVFFDSLKGALKDISELADIGDFLKTHSLGEVQNRDVSFRNQGIDASTVIQ